MSTVDQALATQLANLQQRCGKNLDELKALIRASGLTRHGEIRDMLKRELGMGHGDANTLTHHVLGAAGAPAQGDEVLDAIYTGPKAALRPIHDALMAHVNGFGDFEVAPKKGYLSLRRKKQFAMLGPGTNTRFDLGLNMKGTPGTERLREQPAGGMCSHKVALTRADEVDSALIGWLRSAYDGAG